MVCTPPRFVALALCTVAVASRTYPQTRKSTEYEVKAAYLYNFAKFVEWPQEVTSNSGRTFAVCVLGEDPFGDLLDRVVTGEKIGEKTLIVRRVERADECGGCRIVFIGASEAQSLRAVLFDLEKTNALTVSDIPDFASRGGMIELVLDRDRVRFEVDLSAATRAGIQLSSELLKVARAVRRDSSRLPGPRNLGAPRRKFPSLVDWGFE